MCEHFCNKENPTFTIIADSTFFHVSDLVLDLKIVFLCTGVLPILLLLINFCMHYISCFFCVHLN